MRFLVVTVKMALRALRRNAMRAFLTILGIIIGVAAVIAMVGIGRGASASSQEKIASLGNNMLVIMSGSTTQGGLRRRRRHTSTPFRRCAMNDIDAPRDSPEGARFLGRCRLDRSTRPPAPRAPCAAGG